MVNLMLSEENRLEILLGLFLEKFVEYSTNFEKASIFIHNPSSGNLSLISSSDPQNNTLLIAGNIAEDIYSSGKPYIKTNYRNFNLNKKFDKKMIPKSIIGYPLKAVGRNVGVLLVENFKRKIPEKFDVFPIQAFVDIIMVVIEERNKSNNIREELHCLKNEVIPTLAHDMRALLTSIKGYSTYLLLDGIIENEKKVKEYLKIIDEDTENLEQLVSDLLESFVIDSGYIKIDKEPIIPQRIAEKIVNQISKHTSKHKFIVSFTPKSFIIKADSLKIEQVFYNLIDNAVKYSPSGGIIVIGGELIENEIVISVADQGIGLLPEHLNQLFDKFFRVKGNTQSHISGSGLGLPISKAIVEAHGGRIWAESQFNKGTTLNFSFPLK